jgi:prophage tail gpP-like protein
MPLYTPSISVEFENRGTSTNRVIDYNVDSAYMTSADAFSFTLYEEDLSLVRNLELEPVSIYIDGNLQSRGRIEVTDIGQGPGLAVRCQGRDYFGDLVECHVDPALAVSDKMTLEQVVKLAAKPLGIAKVSFDARPWRNARAGGEIATSLGERTFKGTLKDYKTNPGEGVYQFLARLCARFGCTLQPTMERDSVLLGSPDYVQEPAYDVVRTIANPQSAKNNVLAATARRNYSKFPTVVLVSGKSGSSGQTRKPVSATSYKEGTIEALQNRLVESFGVRTRVTPSILSGINQVNSQTKSDATSVPRNIEETILALLPEGVPVFTQRIPPKVDYVPTNALYRLFYMRDQISKDLDQVMNTAARAAAERLKDCLQYEVTFRGHKDPTTGRTFAVDTIIQVEDDLCDVHEPLWVEHVSFTYDSQRGPTTKLTCWRPGSFGIGSGS